MVLPASVILSSLMKHDRIAWEEIIMVKSRQQTARKPATKYANLQKKMQKQKTMAKKKTGKKK